MEWTKIPDHWVMEANGFSWTDGADDVGGKARNFRVRYAYDMIFKSLCVDIIEDRADGTSDIVMQNDIYEDADTFHLAVAAFECIFAESGMVKNGQFTKLANLLDLYKKDYSAFASRYVETQQQKIHDAMGLLFSAYKFAKKQQQSPASASEEFGNLVRVDFRAGKKAYKPSDDLLEQVRGAIKDLGDEDSPIIHSFGGGTPTPKP